MRHLSLALLLGFLPLLAGAQQDGQPETRTHTEPVPYYPPLPEDKGRDPKGGPPQGAEVSSSGGEGFGIPTPPPEVGGQNFLKDIPVNLYTGTPQVNIPIYTLKEGSLSVPIYLSYNASGIRAGEVASWAGLGWSLEGIPKLTRMVKGLPDEGRFEWVDKNSYRGRKGYYFYGNSAVGDNKEDGEPDWFFLDLGGQTHKFMFDDRKRAHFFPEADIKVEVEYKDQFSLDNISHRFTKFTFTLADGTKYIFVAPESIYEDNVLDVSCEVEVGIGNVDDFPSTSTYGLNRVVSAWPVEKVASPQGQEIRFEHRPLKYSFYKLAENEMDSECGVPELGVNRVFVEQSVISKVIGASTTVSFLGNGREDLEGFRNAEPNNFNTQAPKLTLIQVYSNRNSLAPMSWVLDHGYFTDPGYPTDPLPTGYSIYLGNKNVGTTHERRLKLQGITMPDGTKNSFTYHGEAGNADFGTRLTYGVDHWGYKNGQDANIGEMGLIGKDESSDCGSHRDASAAQMQYASLTGIHSNRGSETLFEYEPHRAHNYHGGTKDIGGLRIKSITEKDSVRGLETRREFGYTYVDGTSSGGLTAHPIYRFHYRQNVLYSNSALYGFVLAETGKPAVGYSRVTVKVRGKNGQSPTGTAEHLFHTGSVGGELRYAYPEELCGTGSSPCYFAENHHPGHDHDSGTQRGKWFLDATGSPVSGQTWQYTPGNGIKYDSTYCTKVTRFNGKIYHNSYYRHFRKYRLESAITRAYSDGDGGTPSTRTVSYTYKDEMPQAYRDTYRGEHNLPVETTLTDERGETTVARNKYTADFSFEDRVRTICDPGACIPGKECPHRSCMVEEVTVIVPPPGYEARGIFEALERHILAAPVETHTLRGGKALAASYQSYHHANSAHTALPHKSFILRGTPKTGFAEATYNAGNYQMERDAGYVEASEVHSYNGVGLPEQGRTAKGPGVRVEYDPATNLLPVARTSNHGSPSALTRSYEYSKAFEGISKQTAPNGLETRYTYEQYTGRLAQVSDGDNRIVARTSQSGAGLSPTPPPPPAPTVSIANNTAFCFVNLSASGCGGTVNWSHGASGPNIAVPTAKSTAYTATCTTPDGTSGNSNSLTIPQLQGQWTATDIGPPTDACTQHPSTDWILKSNGSLGGAANDNVHYVYHKVTGDFTLTLKLKSISPGDGDRSGIMLRSSLDPKAPDFCIFQDGNSYVGTYRRESHGADNLFSGFVQAVNNSTWLRLKRQGSMLYYHYSTDGGSTWQSNFNYQNGAAMPLSIPGIPNTAYIGLATWGTNNQATFNNLSITTP